MYKTGCLETYLKDWKLVKCNSDRFEREDTMLKETIVKKKKKQYCMLSLYKRPMLFLKKAENTAGHWNFLWHWDLMLLVL